MPERSSAPVADHSVACAGKTRPGKPELRQVPALDGAERCGSSVATAPGQWPPRQRLPRIAL